jgi:hypothetical protein
MPHAVLDHALGGLDIAESEGEAQFGDVQPAAAEAGGAAGGKVARSEFGRRGDEAL